MEILWWINIQTFCGLASPFSLVCFYPCLSHLALSHSCSVYLTVSSIRECTCCPRSVCNREPSFSFLVTAIQWWEGTNKRIRQGWHLAVLFPSSSLALSPSHRQTYCISLILTHTLFPSCFLCHTLSHINTHTLWEFASSLWGGLYRPLPWESQPSSFYPEPLRCDLL